MTDEESEKEAAKIINDFNNMVIDEFLKTLNGIPVDRRSWMDEFIAGYLKGKKEVIEQIKPITKT